MPQLEKAYIDTGKVKYVIRDFPLESIHKFARKASEAVWCANEQGKIWEMHDHLFANYRQLQPEALVQYAQAVGLDVPAFQTCLDSGKYTAKINASLQEGQKAGVRGTPAFWLGYTVPESGEIKAIKFLNGAFPFNTFKQTIDQLLETKK